MPKIYSTKEIASKVGVHSNTVRSYEKQGYISEVKRSKNGYRRYTDKHLTEMKLAWWLLAWPYPGGRRHILEILDNIKKGCFDEVLEMTKFLQERIKEEIQLGKDACNQIKLLAELRAEKDQKYSIPDVCSRLNITSDALRNWERNGLITLPRYPNNYRYVTEKEIALLKIIRVLRKCGYSMLNILRMLKAWKKGEKKNLIKVLDTPQKPEDLLHVSNFWLTTLKHKAKKTQQAINFITKKLLK